MIAIGEVILDQEVGAEAGATTEDVPEDRTPDHLNLECVAEVEPAQEAEAVLDHVPDHVPDLDRRAGLERNLNVVLRK